MAESNLKKFPLNLSLYLPLISMKLKGIEENSAEQTENLTVEERLALASQQEMPKKADELNNLMISSREISL